MKTRWRSQVTADVTAFQSSISIHDKPLFTWPYKRLSCFGCLWLYGVFLSDKNEYSLPRLGGFNYFKLNKSLGNHSLLRFLN